MTISEVLRGVRQLLDRYEIVCEAFPDQVTVDLLVDAVADALGRCGRPN